MRFGAHERSQPMVKRLLSLVHVVVDLLSSFLEGPKAALTASKDFEGGHYKSIPQHGLRAFGRVYSAWAYGQAVRGFHTLGPCKRNDVRDSGSARISTSRTVCESFVCPHIDTNINCMHCRYPDLNSFLHECWGENYIREWDANDMLTMLNTWQTGDVAKIHGDPDLQTALGRIKAKGLIMPSKTDLYFPVRFTHMLRLDRQG